MSPTRWQSCTESFRYNFRYHPVALLFNKLRTIIKRLIVNLKFIIKPLIKLTPPKYFSMLTILYYDNSNNKQ